MASTLRSAASVRTGVSGGGRSGGQASGAVRKPAVNAVAAPVRPVRILPKLIENNQDVTPKRLIDPEQFYNKVKESVLTHDVSSTPSEAAYSVNQQQVFSATKSVIGLSHGGALNSHGTDAESFPSEQDTDQLGQSVAIHGIDDEQSLMSIDGEAPQPLLTLSETDTIFVLSIDSSIVANDSTDIETIKQKNERYVELCKSKQGSDIFNDRGMNTFNSTVKNKDVQCEKVTFQSREAFASTADMYDSERGESKAILSTVGHEPETVHDTPIRIDQTRSISSGGGLEKSHGTRLSDQSIDDTMRKSVTGKSTNNEPKVPEPFDSSKIATSVFIMERVLNLNTNQLKQAIYRGLPPLVTKIETGSAYTGLTLDKLFGYNAEITSNKNVSALAWNQKNADLLAVGYGPFEYNDQRDGLVCCWSLKNQDFPERYFHTHAAVTTVAFSVKFPSLLAVGLFDGTVNVYDVQQNYDKPLLDTEEAAGKHTAPVWQLYWSEVEKGRDDDTGEVLMSISTDGRVTQWLLRKGFESNDYMKLKRILSKQTVQKRESGGKSSKPENLLFRTSGGLCFDVCPDDKTIYLCGTEEGLIHRCSISYNEQYLDTFSAHTGPIYRIAWSPMAKGVFLSSSADWTVSLWKVDRFQPCVTFSSRKKPVFDICWSPKSATMFCCANEDAIEVWDLSKNTLEPINVILATAQYIFTSVTYSPNSDCILAGTSSGSVMVYHLKNLPPASTVTDLMNVIEQQTHHLSPSEDTATSVSSNVVAKPNITATTGAH